MPQLKIDGVDGIVDLDAEPGTPEFESAVDEIKQKHGRQEPIIGPPAPGSFRAQAAARGAAINAPPVPPQTGTPFPPQPDLPPGTPLGGAGGIAAARESAANAVPIMPSVGAPAAAMLQAAGNIPTGMLQAAKAGALELPAALYRAPGRIQDTIRQAQGLPVSLDNANFTPQVQPGFMERGIQRLEAEAARQRAQPELQALENGPGVAGPVGQTLALGSSIAPQAAADPAAFATMAASQAMAPPPADTSGDPNAPLQAPPEQTPAQATTAQNEARARLAHGGAAALMMSKVPGMLGSAVPEGVQAIQGLTGAVARGATKAAESAGIFAGQEALDKLIDGGSVQEVLGAGLEGAKKGAMLGAGMGLVHAKGGMERAEELSRPQTPTIPVPLANPETPQGLREFHNEIPPDVQKIIDTEDATPEEQALAVGVVKEYTQNVQAQDGPVSPAPPDANAVNAERGQRTPAPEAARSTGIGERGNQIPENPVEGDAGPGDAGKETAQPEIRGAEATPPPESTRGPEVPANVEAATPADRTNGNAGPDRGADGGQISQGVIPTEGDRRVGPQWNELGQDVRYQNDRRAPGNFLEDRPPSEPGFRIPTDDEIRAKVSAQATESYPDATPEEKAQAAKIAKNELHIEFAPPGQEGGWRNEPLTPKLSEKDTTISDIPTPVQPTAPAHEMTHDEAVAHNADEDTRVREIPGYRRQLVVVPNKTYSERAKEQAALAREHLDATTAVRDQYLKSSPEGEGLVHYDVAVEKAKRALEKTLDDGRDVNKLTFEAVAPGFLQKMTPPDREEYTQKVLTAVDHKHLARLAGVDPRGLTVVPGYWDGVSNPAVHIEWRPTDGMAPEEIKASAQRLAATLGTVHSQDGVGYLMASVPQFKRQANMVKYDFGRTLTPDEAVAIGTEIDKLGSSATIPDEHGVTVINFVGSDDLPAWQTAVHDAVRRVAPKDVIPTDYQLFKNSGGLVEKSDYDEIHKQAGGPERPDLKEGIDQARTAVDKIRAEYGRKYARDAAQRAVRVTESTAGPVRGFHLSSQEGLTETDPAFQGTGKIGAEKARVGQPGEVPYTNFYLDKDTGVVESHLFGGKHMYGADLNITNEPGGLISAEKIAGRTPEELKTAGYTGIAFPGHEQAHVWGKTPVQYEGKTRPAALTPTARADMYREDIRSGANTLGAAGRGDVPDQPPIGHRLAAMFGKDGSSIVPGPKDTYSTWGNQKDIFGGYGHNQLAMADERSAGAARYMAGASSKAKHLIDQATPEISRALGLTKDMTPGERKAGVAKFYDALAESRLQGIADKAGDFATQTEEMPDVKLRDAIANGHFDTMLDALEGRKGFEDRDLQAEWAQKLKNIELGEGKSLAHSAGRENQFGTADPVELKDATEIARNFLTDTIETWRDGIGTTLPEAKGFSAYTETPEFQKALGIYKSTLETPMRKMHELNDGAFADRLGPLDTYFPLSSLNEKSESGRTSKTVAFRKPKNANSFFATGLGDYDTGGEALRRNIARGISQNGKAGLLTSLQDSGLLKQLAKGQAAPSSMVWRGDEYKARAVDIGISHMISTDGKVVSVPATKALVPEWVAKELKPLLEPEHVQHEAHILKDVLDATTSFNLGGPTDAVYHSANLIGTLALRAPIVGTSLAAKVASYLPLVKSVAAIANVMAIDPTAPEHQARVQRMIENGQMPSRMGESTYSKQYAEQTGAEYGGPRLPWHTSKDPDARDLPLVGKTRPRLPIDFSPMIFGPKGVDARARVLMDIVGEEIAKARGSTYTPREAFEWTRQMGNYVYSLEGRIERGAKASGFSPFYTAGRAMNVNGIAGMLGAGHLPGEGSQVFNQFTAARMTSGIIGVTALWAAMNKMYRDKWPWEDEESRLWQIPLTAEDRDTKLARSLYGDDVSKTAYVNIAGMNALMARGARITGVKAAMEGALAKRGAAETFDKGEVDAINGWLHPFLGPPTHFITAAVAGKETYIERLHTNDKPDLKLKDSFPGPLESGLPGAAQKVGHAFAAANPIVRRVGQAHEEGSPAGRVVADTFLPNILKGPYRSNDSPLGSYLRDYASEHPFGSKPLTKEERQGRDAVTGFTSRLRSAIETGNKTKEDALDAEIAAAVKSGKITDEAVKKIDRDASKPKNAAAFSRLPLPNAIEAYERANPKERLELADYLDRKKPPTDMSEAEGNKLMARVDELLKP